ncbi:hypothetical protein A2870_04435 [Candidatus Curtissbacteria bacterium RIFCSPHIGHO2_01_FULL_41_11]|uniref:Peptidase S9 prolyl oligopeptidase catalytic domain-containing protein n=1 Tax=Candidatus Curtissbacteria bacterium RIFCSPHIGHO2_01_FULL_41_11 TaxID=1797711 RepID=A0A1F5G516_9BACT|nr:MAG: hypothetical protein A2870_04435 [Candidatus Curtissbacteria bacterium RIFCSPHIGHO2_01_FULL_41_11]
MVKILFLISAAAFAGTFFVLRTGNDGRITEPRVREEALREKPLDKYTIEALSKANIDAGEITLGEVLGDDPAFTSYKFYFYVQGDPSTSSGFKKVSGLLNVPKPPGAFGVIVMFRGYVDREQYQTGVGTQRAGEVFAKGGFVTLAPDFLGYGESDNPSDSAIEERLQTYVTALTVLESVGKLNDAFSKNNIDAEILPDKVGIWGHSNGGQIALTVLEITGKNYPAVMWAPVSKPFPYSILYYTDDFDDHGKMLRRVVADFEKDYDAEKYSLSGYFDRINAPMQVHQGTGDDAVPLKWSDQMVEQFNKLNKDIEYFTYSGADHNLLPGGWNPAVVRAISFFKQKLLI